MRKPIENLTSLEPFCSAPVFSVRQTHREPTGANTPTITATPTPTIMPTPYPPGLFCFLSLRNTLYVLLQNCINASCSTQSQLRCGLYETMICNN